jgi:uncharacterized membrane protein
VKVYLAILAVVMVGFFLFADWYASPAGGDPLSWMHLAQTLLALLTMVVGWRTARQELDKQHHQSGK